MKPEFLKSVQEKGEYLKEGDFSDFGSPAGEKPFAAWD